MNKVNVWVASHNKQASAGLLAGTVILLILVVLYFNGNLKYCKKGTMGHKSKFFGPYNQTTGYGQTLNRLGQERSDSVADVKHYKQDRASELGQPDPNCAQRTWTETSKTGPGNNGRRNNAAWNIRMPPSNWDVQPAGQNIGTGTALAASATSGKSPMTDAQLYSKIYQG